MNKNAWVVIIIAIVVLGGIYLYGKAPEGGSLNSNATSTVSTSSPIDNSKATSTNSGVTKSYGQIKLGIGERVNYPEGFIKIVSVDEDSRCATGVQCIWAGTVKTTLEYSVGGSTKKGTLELNKSITRGNEKITLTGVSPAALPGKEISDADYVFTLQVSKTGNSTAGPIVSGGCFVGGCSGQICSEDPGAISTCEYRDAYACYKTAKCERQQNGQCGWTQTSELQMCLANAR